MASCHVEDWPSDLWRECAIIDVSTLGLGIELLHPDPVELLGLWRDGELRLDETRRITVGLELGPSVDITVSGELRNAGSQPDGIVRAGIEFVGLTEAERSMVDHLVREVSVNNVEALGRRKKIADPIPHLGELPEGLVEALGRRQTDADPVPVPSEPPESHVEAVGRPKIVEALGPQQAIPDPVPEVSELPDCLVEARGQEQTILAPIPEVIELSEEPVEARREAKRNPDPLPGLSELARMGGELAFLSIRVISSDVLDLVGRFPARPRIPNVAGLHPRLGFGGFRRAGKLPTNPSVVHPVESEDLLRQEGL
jgi:hypothetical protein